MRPLALAQGKKKSDPTIQPVGIWCSQNRERKREEEGEEKRAPNIPPCPVGGKKKGPKRRAVSQVLRCNGKERRGKGKGGDTPTGNFFPMERFVFGMHRGKREKREGKENVALGLVTNEGEGGVPMSLPQGEKRKKRGKEGGYPEEPSSCEGKKEKEKKGRKNDPEFSPQNKRKKKGKGRKGGESQTIPNFPPPGKKGVCILVGKKKKKRKKGGKERKVSALVLPSGKKKG